ncbi:FtsX-like permease family protein [Kitasatospora phosalacinea]|uniref:FtsX-like permease family protein n=1 Tax=Kitasatospora phosalacinea TaxID=2065 RepID=UPI000527F937|nr:FtsX-like permease family protein [Kitasatospora phosalacinea]
MLGFVLLRLRGRLPLAAAVLFTVLIATTVLTTLVAFDRTVAEAGVRRDLAGAGRAAVLLDSDHGLGARGADDAAVAALGTDLFDGLPVAVRSLARSRAYGLPAQSGSSPAAAAAPASAPAAPAREVDLTVLAALERDRVRLTAGRWPAERSADGTVQVAVPGSALSRLGLAEDALPARAVLSDRYGGPPLTVEVTGVYRAEDRDAPYWRLDPLGGREIQVRGFTTYGPMLVDDRAFTSGLLPQGGRSALLSADFTDAGRERIGRVGERADRLAELIRRDAPGFQSQTELPALLAELRAATLVTESGLLIGGLQLAVLAGAALLLVVRLVAGRQAREDALLAARGATRGRLAAWTAVEALLLALPAALLAPLLTGPLLRLLTWRGPLAGLPLEHADTAVRWPAAALCALLCVALAALPALLRRGRARVVSRRQAVVGTAVRSGADLALLALAAVAYRQLDGRTGGLSVDAGGRLGIDPVLVAAPTLALCAGTLLVLRVLPFAARLGARLAARGRGLGVALGGWQLARRPGRANGPVLLLVLAVACGMLAVGQHAAWHDSQRDQADFAAAGGLRIQGSALPPLGQGGRYARLPGGDRLLPVARIDQSLPGRAQGGVLLTDTVRAAAELRVRPDLFDGRPPGELLAPLAAPQPSGVPLPGHPVRIDLVVGVSVEAAEHLVRDAPPPQAPGLWLWVRDGFGTAHRLLVPQLPARGELTVSVDLDALAAAPLGSAAGPLTLTGFGLTYPSGGNERSSELTVRRIEVADRADGPGVPVPVPAGAWSLRAEDGSPVRLADGPAADRLLTASYAAPPDHWEGAHAVLLPPGGDARPDREVRGLATRGYLAAVGGAVGELVQVKVGGTAVPVRISGAVEALPVQGGTGLLLDLADTGRWLAERDLDVPAVSEWWLPAAGPGDRVPAEAAAALRAGPTAQRLTLREEDAAARLGDPLSAAPQSMLVALALAASVLAAIGFAAASAAAAAERAGESAVLLALGTPRRLLHRSAAAEQVVLVGLGTGVGLLLGAALVHLVVPLVVLTPAARPPFPGVLVDLPPGRVLALTAATAALPLCCALFLGGPRRKPPAARLRATEDA